MKAHYEKKKKVNSIVIKETTIFKKSSSKQLWNLKNVAVTFTDRSELSDQQHRDFLSLPRGTCRTMRAQNRAGQGGHRRGEGMRGRGEKTQKKLMHKVEGELFFPLFEISDVNRKQRRQRVESTVCKHPIGKINVLPPSPVLKPDMAWKTKESFQTLEGIVTFINPCTPSPNNHAPLDRDFPSYLITFEAFWNQKDNAMNVDREGV